LQLLQDLSKTVDISLEASDSSADLRRHELAFGHLPFDIQLSVFGDFHGKHELSKGQVEPFVKVDALRVDVEMNDQIFVQFSNR
jgi:hypothetical protein